MWMWAILCGLFECLVLLLASHMWRCNDREAAAVYAFLLSLVALVLFLGPILGSQQ